MGIKGCSISYHKVLHQLKAMITNTLPCVNILEDSKSGKPDEGLRKVNCNAVDSLEK